MKRGILLITSVLALTMSASAQLEHIWSFNTGAYAPPGFLYNSEIEPYQSIVSANGDLYVAGFFYGDTIDLDPGAGQALLTQASSSQWDPNLFVARYDSSGALIWAKQMPSSGSIQFHDLIADGAGGLYVCGEFNDYIDLDPGAGISLATSSGVQKTFIVKLNSNGVFQWGNTFDVSQPQFTFDAPNNELIMIAQAVDDPDLDPGAGVSPTMGNSQSRELAIARYDANGNYVGGYEWGFVNSTTRAQGVYGVEVMPNGKLVIHAILEGDFQLDPSGGATALALPVVKDLIFTIDLSTNVLSNYVIQEFYSSWVEARELNVNSGNEIFLYCIVSDGADLDPTAGTNIVTASGGTDYAILKFDQFLNYVDGFSIPANGAEYNGVMHINDIDEVVICGTFEGSGVDFDPSGGMATVPNNGLRDGFIAKYDSNLDFIWVDAFGGLYTDVAWSIALNNATDEVMIVATIAGGGSLDMDFGPNSNQLDYNDGRMILAKYYECLPQDTSVVVVENTLTAVASGTNYQWLDCVNGNAPISGATGQSFSPTANGEYAVAISTGNCTSVSSCFAITTIGLKEVDKDLFEVFPNPATDNIEIQSVQSVEVILLSDQSGRVLESIEMPTSSIVDVSELESGVYYVTLISGGASYCKKLIVSGK